MTDNSSPDRMGTALDLAAIRSRAEAATPGPWEFPQTIHGDPFIIEKGKGRLLGGGIAMCDRRDDYGRSNAFHIAGMDPTTTLHLLDLVTAERARADRATEQLVAAAAVGVQMPLDAVLLGYRDGDEHGWHQEFCWLEANHMPALDALATSVQETGMREPILLGDDGRVWDGHHRLWVAQKLALPTVPVTFSALRAASHEGSGL